MGRNLTAGKKMIPGVVASQQTAANDGPAVGGALLDFDFLNQVYEVNGVSVTAASFLTTTGDIGVNGLNIPLLGTPNTILGDAATVLLAANWTAVIEFVSITSSGNLDLFCLAETPIVGNRDLFRCGYPSSPAQWFAQDADATPLTRTAVVGTKASGLHKMAVTRTDSKLIVAVDGELSLESTTPLTLDEVDTATFGGPAEASNGREANIHTFIVYPEQTDAVLLELSI
jgi:hypothetical protein